MKNIKFVQIAFRDRIAYITDKYINNEHLQEILQDTGLNFYYLYYDSDDGCPETLGQEISNKCWGTLLSYTPIDNYTLTSREQRKLRTVCDIEDAEKFLRLSTIINK